MADVLPLAQLGVAFNFTPDDLEFNRSKRLSGRQGRYLMRRFYETLGLAILMIGLPIIVSLAILSWDSSQSLGNQLFSLEGIISIVVGLLLGIVFLIANRHKMAIVADVSRKRVVSITGKTQRRGVYVRVGNKRFIIEEVTLDLIQTGLRYTFYYLPYSQQIVAVEFAE